MISMYDHDEHEENMGKTPVDLEIKLDVVFIYLTLKIKDLIKLIQVLLKHLQVMPIFDIGPEKRNFYA